MIRITRALAGGFGLAVCILSSAVAQEPIEGAADGHRRMIELLRKVAEETARDSVFLRSQKLDQLRPAVLNPTARQDLENWFWLNYELGMEEYYFGTIEGAIRHLEAAWNLLTDPEDPDHKTLRSRLAYYLGMAHLRRGERANCVGHHNAQSCIFPIREGGVHQQKEGSRRAIEYFQQVLEELPEKTVERVAARWLLNIAYMTIGGYPSQVPKEELIEPERLASEAAFPQLENIAQHAGLGTFNHAGGMVVDDFSGDLLPDVLTSSWHPSENIRYFENRGDRTFAERTNVANLEGLTGGLNMVQADYDNDGDLDVLVLRGAWLREFGRHPNSLLQNDGKGVFTDVTFAAGLGEIHYPTQTASWADYDNDGDLDLYIGNEATPEQQFPSQLFRNDGKGRFRDVASEAGVENLRYAKAVVWGDYDGDRFPDLYVSNFHGHNRLYHNNGNGAFRDLAAELGVALPGESFPSWFWDFDNDGALDLLVNAYPDAEGPMRLYLVAAGYFGIEVKAEPTRLYRGDGRGGFVDVARERNLTKVMMPMGANFGDLDGDGYLDFYLATGYPRYYGLMPNVLYWNRRGHRFDDVTTDSGLGHLQKGHGVAFADFDGDGDLDVFEELGGFFPLDGYANALFENPGFGNHWLQVRLVGRHSNRSAIGARIRVDLIEEGQSRSVYRTVNSGGTFGGNPLMQHIGLGRAERVERLQIYWPTSDSTQEFPNLAADQLLEIVEGETSFRLLTPPWKDQPPGGSDRHH